MQCLYFSEIPYQDSSCPISLLLQCLVTIHVVQVSRRPRKSCISRPTVSTQLLHCPPGPLAYLDELLNLIDLGAKGQVCHSPVLSTPSTGREGAFVRPGGHYHVQSTNKSLSEHMRFSLLEFNKICRPDICSPLSL